MICDINGDCMLLILRKGTFTQKEQETFYKRTLITMGPNNFLFKSSRPSNYTFRVKHLSYWNRYRENVGPCLFPAHLSHTTYLSRAKECPISQAASLAMEEIVISDFQANRRRLLWSTKATTLTMRRLQKCLTWREMRQVVFRLSV
jgi:hypothetical protein